MTLNARSDEDSAAQDTAAQDTAAQDTAAEDSAAQDTAAQDTAARVWVAMRHLVGSHPTKERMRAALDLGRGSGRVKSLMWLADGPMSLSALAEAVGVDAPYATLIVDNLEERGLVARQPDPADRRRKLVTLTPEGNKAIEKLQRIEREPPPGFARLSAAELDTLADLVRRVAELSGHTGPAPGGGSAGGSRTRCRCWCGGIRYPLPVPHPPQTRGTGNGCSFRQQRYRHWVTYGEEWAASGGRRLAKCRK